MSLTRLLTGVLLSSSLAGAAYFAPRGGDSRPEDDRRGGQIPRRSTPGRPIAAVFDFDDKDASAGSSRRSRRRRSPRASACRS